MRRSNRGRDDLLERSTARAKAIRSGNSPRLEVQWTSNASFASERLERERYLTFGGFWWVRHSKRGESLSRLEGFGGLDAPNAGKASHIWRGYRGLGAPNARESSHIWRVTEG